MNKIASVDGQSERAASMHAFFEPSSIAVIGASPNPGRGGHRILENLLQRFDGAIYAVNPHVDEVLGLPAYPDVTAVPGDVDLAIIFIPAPAISQVVRDCVAKGVKAVCIESGGFADAGPEGEALQREIQELVRGTVTRVWGPNCAGYVSTRPPLSTSFVVTPDRLDAGNVSLIAQSGMMAAALLVQILSQEMFTIDKACSIGNKADVDESDLLEYLAAHSDSDVIALYLESINDGARFLAALDNAIERSTVLALMGGLSETGAQVALGHTGSVAATDVVVSGMLRQRGVLQARDFMELVELAGALSTLPIRAAGNRIGVLTFSGAAGVVSADLFAEYGLSLAELSDETRARLAEIYPRWVAPTNPVDVWSTVELRGLESTITASLEALIEDDGVDAILFMPLAFDFFADADLETFAALARRAGKPIVAWPFGEDEHLVTWQRALRAGGVAVCRSLHAAVRVLEALVLRRQALVRLETLRARDSDAERWTLQVPPRSTTATVGEEETKRLLSRHGIPVVAELRANTPGEAAAAAEEIGFPVVCKLAAPGLAHKAELGAVVLNLGDAAAVELAAGRLLEIGRANAIDNRHVLVQPMVRDGVETIVGARRDPLFGPIVVFGVGGIFVETLRDVAVRPAPVTEADVRAMIAEVRAARLLVGGRGRPPADVDALVATLLALSELISTAPEEVQEIEANPLIVLPAGSGAVAVDGLLVVGPSPH